MTMSRSSLELRAFMLLAAGVTVSAFVVPSAIYRIPSPVSVSSTSFGLLMSSMPPESVESLRAAAAKAREEVERLTLVSTMVTT
jgi:hypothetical protein